MGRRSLACCGRTSLGQRAKRHLRFRASVFLLPLLEECAVTACYVMISWDSKIPGHTVDPAWRTFDLPIISDGSPIQNHASMAIAPLAAKLLVAEHRTETQRLQNAY